MSRDALMDFGAGAVTMGYLIAGIYFLRFWRKTGDRLFRGFAAAFWLFALNQAIVTGLGVRDERTGYAYLLRVIGFLIILFAIIRKNVNSRTSEPPPGQRPSPGRPAPGPRR